VLLIQLQRQNHHPEITAFRQCSADKEEHDMANCPHGGG
jgi:hypothetical protein